jgi:hypothetical protein
MRHDASDIMERGNLLETGSIVDDASQLVRGLEGPAGPRPLMRLKRILGFLLSSTSFWIFAITLVLIDLVIFSWQVIYTSDSRLEHLEALISGLFVFELMLRQWAFDSQCSWCVRVLLFFSRLF